MNWSHDFFFYLENDKQWPGSYCKKSSAGCCLPKNGQPELDFFVEGLFPYSKDATPLTNCNESPFHLGQVLTSSEYNIIHTIKWFAKLGLII